MIQRSVFDPCVVIPPRLRCPPTPAPPASSHHNSHSARLSPNRSTSPTSARITIAAQGGRSPAPSAETAPGRPRRPSAPNPASALPTQHPDGPPRAATHYPPPAGPRRTQLQSRQPRTPALAEHVRHRLLESLLVQHRLQLVLGPRPLPPQRDPQPNKQAQLLRALVGRPCLRQQIAA